MSKEEKAKEWRAVMTFILWIFRKFIWLMVIVMGVNCAILVLYRLPIVRPISTLIIKDEVLRQDYQRQWVAFEDISPHLVNAVMMAEDGRFCSHYGVDWQALHGEITRDGGPSRGASTISMQLIKNLFLWHGSTPPQWLEAIPHSKGGYYMLTYLRKGLEIPLALAANVILPKKRVMEIYLNIAEWGQGIYGVEAAAQFYFKRSAAHLTPKQGALLAVSLPNPHWRNPARPSAELNRMAQLIQNRAARSGAYIGCLK